MKIKKLDLYISKNFIKSFLISLIAFINIFILSQLFKIFRYVADGRMTTTEGILYILNMLPKIIINVTPLAVLLGALMVISKMASNLEIISLKTSGISFRRIILFPVIISFFISLIVYWVNGNLYPDSIKRMKELKGNYSSKVVPKEKRNAFLRSSDNKIYMIGYINAEKSIARDFEIIELNKSFSKIEKVVIAENAKYNREKNYWELENVTINNIPEEESFFEKNYKEISYTEVPENFMTLSIDPELLTNKELKKELVNLRITGGDTREGLVELGKRYSFPFSSFIMIFIGLSLGSKYVRGASARNIAFSIIFGYGYYIIQASFEAFSKNNLINPFLSGWIPNILFLILGIFFVYKAEY